MHPNKYPVEIENHGGKHCAYIRQRARYLQESGERGGERALEHLIINGFFCVRRFREKSMHRKGKVLLGVVQVLFFGLALPRRHDEPMCVDKFILDN